ncbi:MAG: agmatine deiminase family protein [Candidatus Marinimicrobia bacterium]|nr:agmatine deiminase family protein [Candidatus Neomarinimicrobiota bacterium]MBL7023752.1 agmatine deiminase family protein [Candidatus Neomarinimicrobiota bacterium]MBL7108949.1 agmatine deiminase family protein [Candidatus Neomarinimicrobiota bacterium]
MWNQIKYIVLLTFLGFMFAQFENIPENENIILLVGPDNYYQNSINEITQFHINFASSPGSRDHIFIMMNNYNDSYYQGNVSSDRLFYGNINDIWIRDFGTQQILQNQYKFDYSPEYLDNWTSNWINNSYLDWLNTQEFDYSNESIILDGGNFVTDRISKAVVTTRIFDDNPGFSESDLRTYFQVNLGIEQIAFVPEEEGDITGHSDGMVFWLTPSKLAVNDYDEPFRTEVYNALIPEFPNVEFINMPYAPTDEVSPDGFPSCKGIYVNALQTTDNIYVPIYNLPEDSEAISVFEAHTNKTIIPVDADEVSLWGGSVHCLSWEVLRASSIIMGDVNSDGVVDIFDITFTVSYILGIESEIQNADMNNDGVVNVIDIVMIVDLILNE